MTKERGGKAFIRPKIMKFTFFKGMVANHAEVQSIGLFDLITILVFFNFYIIGPPNYDLLLL